MLVLVAAGCSTPESRIHRHAEVFAQLDAVQQEMIRRGEIGIGFTPAMVHLALGEPDRIRTRTDTEGTGEIWSYVTYESPDGGLLYRGWYHRDYVTAHPLFPYYLTAPAPSRRERERFRVVFREGRVIEIEKETGG